MVGTRESSGAVLITVSGTIGADLQADVAAGRRPRADYAELAAAVSGDLIDYTAAGTQLGLAGRAIVRLLGPDVALAVACLRRRRRLQVLFTDSERVGMIYATLCMFCRTRPAHVMIGHRLSPPKKRKVHNLLRLRRRIDHVVVYASTQRDVAIDALGYDPDQVTLTPFMVDTAFWRRDESTATATVQRRPMICAVGQELRDYPTLIAAVGGLDLEVVVAAASPWSKRADTSAGLEIPDNVSVRRLGPFNLRQLYAEASFVVVPLQETDFQAGITTILEAMSMGLAVICTRTTGQTDAIADGVTGRYVAPGDIVGLRSTIAELLPDREQCERIGRAARCWAVDHADIEHYARTLAGVMREAAR